MNATLKSRPGTLAFVRRQVRADSLADRAQFPGLGLPVRTDEGEGLVGVEPHIVDDRSPPVAVLVAARRAEREPRRGARRQEADHEPRGELAKSQSGKPSRRAANRGFGRNGLAQAGERRLLEQRVEGGADRRARVPQRFVARAQSRILLQALKQAVPAVLVEFVVDQCDKLLVFVSHLLAQTPYFKFASADLAVARRLMTVPIGMPSATAASA